MGGGREEELSYHTGSCDKNEEIRRVQFAWRKRKERRHGYFSFSYSILEWRHNSEYSNVQQLFPLFAIYAQAYVKNA